jgi:hypothetical protein
MGTSPGIDGIENDTWHMMLLSRTQVVSPLLDWKEVTITVTRQIYLYCLRYRTDPQTIGHVIQRCPLRTRTHPQLYADRP